MCVCSCSPTVSGALVNESCCTASLKLCCCRLCFFDQHKPLPGSSLHGHWREATMCVWVRRSCDLWLVFTVDLCSYRSLCISALSGYRPPVTRNTDKIIMIDYILKSSNLYLPVPGKNSSSHAPDGFLIFPLMKKLWCDLDTSWRVFRTGGWAGRGDKETTGSIINTECVWLQVIVVPLSPLPAPCLCPFILERLYSFICLRKNDLLKTISVLILALKPVYFSPLELNIFKQCSDLS